MKRQEEKRIVTKLKRAQGLTALLLSALLLSVQLAYAFADNKSDTARLSGDSRPKITGASSSAFSPTPGSALSPGAKEAANLLGILPKVDRLIELQNTRSRQGADTLSDEEL